MCGIVAQVGARACKERVLDGLRVLEYRGYDSAGIAFYRADAPRIEVVKAVGELSQLEARLDGVDEETTCAVGHTRWATHGKATCENAHPHVDTFDSVAVVHNGIIEDCHQLRETLRARGHDITSQTDTELAAHLLSDLIKEHRSLERAACALLSSLEGAYSFVFLLKDYPEQLLVVRRRSPLVLGKGDGCYMAASDQLAFPDDVRDVTFVPDESIGIITAHEQRIFDVTGAPLALSLQPKAVAAEQRGKAGFAHYMLKEMYEQHRVINRTVQFYQVIGGRDDAVFHEGQATHNSLWKQLALSAEQIHGLKKIYIIAAGSSWHAGRISQFFFEQVLDMPVSVLLASEFRYMPFFPDKDAIYIFISQSGETADTLEAMRMVRRERMHTIALTNVASSTIVREADGFLLMHAGPEISVASTKAFSCQVVSLYWLAHRLALERNLIDGTAMRACEDELLVAGQILQATMERYKDELTTALAPRYACFDRMIFLGRQISYPFALEAALKLKEISYIFAQCYPAGELKHGPIALIDSKTPVVIFSVLDELIYQKLIANVQEVKARNGHVVIFAFEGQHELIALADTVFIIPRVAPLLGPLAMTGVMQYFAYALTNELGHPIDKPRNLAKSVTVE